MEHDKYICQLCGSIAYASGHILHRKIDRSSLLDTDNGRALCKECHSRYGSELYRIYEEDKPSKNIDLFITNKFVLRPDERALLTVHKHVLEDIKKYALKYDISIAKATHRLFVYALKSHS